MTWTNLTSNTTNRNTSRFLDISPSRNSATSGVDFAPTVTANDANAHGTGFFIDDNDPVTIYEIGETGI